ncbi:hypothetical protein ACFSR7_05945 [Cohnella sp. GCM10020058]|uniref:hypothetical protein n=1 Tax=Cohnella sp. GCM10020058 TaxID=3317330 RepID=UPI00363B17AA
MDRKDTRLLPYLVEYETILKNVALTDEKNDMQMAALMTAMERQFSIPWLNNMEFNAANAECIELYRKIGDARVTLRDEDKFIVGRKLYVVDGDEERLAKAFDKKDLGTSVWYLLNDQDNEWGYALDAGTIEWTGTRFVYDCRKNNTPLSSITGRDLE